MSKWAGLSQSCLCVHVYLWTSSFLTWGMGCNPMSVEHFLLCTCSLCIHAFLCVHWVSSRVVCLGVRLCIYVCVSEEAMSHCGPPARPCDSWGPLRQLRPTAHSDSIIMGSLLLRFPNTHSDTCTHTYVHTNHTSPGLLWPFPWVLSNQATAGATCPSRKGKVAIFDISINKKGCVVVMVVAETG